jgi:prepilin peptidase CpaA
MSCWLLPGIAVAVAAVASITDLRNGRIPNKLTLSATLLGLAGHGICHGVSGFVESLFGIVACAAVPGSVYAASQGRAIGGGDIKLFAALGALLGCMQGLEVEFSAFAILGVFALFRLAFLGQLGRTLVGSMRVTVGLFVSRLRWAAEQNEVTMTPMRLGPAILLAVGVTLCLPYLRRWLPWLG